MSKNIGLLKGTVVIEGELLGAEQELLAKKYKSKKVFELWRAQYPSLVFLKKFPCLEKLSLIKVKIKDAHALSEISTLKNLFLNEARFDCGWNFLSDLTQIEELYILNARGELVLPDLGKLDQLKVFRIWGCKGLSDISILKNARQLEEVDLVDTALTPDKLLPLFEMPSVRYINASFGTKKDSDLFQKYLDKYGKKCLR